MLVQISEARFRAAYQLGRQLTVRTFEARDHSEHVVMVHFLGRVDDPETQKLVAELATLPPGRKTGLESAFQVGQEVVVVTRFMPHVQSFDDWFVSVAGEKTLSDQSASGRRSDIPYDGPTILTAELEGGAGPTERPAAHADIRRATEPQAPKEDAGDFTRMFGPIEADSEHPASDEPPGEIVASFGDASASEEPEVGVARNERSEPPRKQPGEFTRMFGALADEPAEPLREGTARPETETPAADPGAPAPSPGKGDGGFTEMFGPTDRPPADAGQSQTLVEEPRMPRPPGRPPRPPEDKPRAEARPGKPRIVWRDRAKEQAPPQPGEPEMKVRWQEEDVPQPPPSAAPPVSPPKKAPGQFTEIFGQALSSETESAGSQPAAGDELDFPMDGELPPQYTGPRKSVSEQVAPLPERASSDYLRALSGDSHVEPPRPAAAPEPSPKQQEQALPDLPPPISSAPPPAPGPSDYTRVIAGGAVQPREAPPPPPPPAQAPAASPAPAAQEPAEPQTPTWLWIALAAIGIVAALLIVLVLLT